MNLRNRILAVLSPPTFPDVEKTRVAALQNIMSWVTFTVALVMIPISWLVMPPAVVAAVFLLVGVQALTIIWLHQGYVRRASLTYIFVTWTILTIPAFWIGGLESPITLFPLIMVLAAGLVVNVRFSIIVAILSALAYSVILVLGSRGLLAKGFAPVTDLRRFIVLIILLIFIVVMVNLALTSLRLALEQLRRDEKQLIDSNRDLEELRISLEQRISVRTKEMERRAIDFQTASEIMRAIASIRNLDELLNSITQTISNRFGHYHVSVFLFDAERKNLVLRSASSAGGQRMLKRNYQVSVDEAGILGTVASSRQPRLDLDMNPESVVATTPDLPDSRSQIALPLQVGDQLLGVLDVQSTLSSAFMEDDLAVLQTLTDQIAVAIENVQLFAESQEKVESMERAYGDIRQEGWRKLLRTQSHLAFRSTAAGGGLEAESPWSPEMQQSLQRGEVIQVDQTLVMPIKAQNQVMGVLRLRKPDDSSKWSEGERSLVQSLTEQLSVALESARLYQETRRRAEREKLTGEITARLRQTNDPKMILETAAQELRRALQTEHLEISLQSAPTSGDTLLPDEVVVG